MVTHPTVSWDEFLLLPERPENGIRYELHDGEVILVPPPRPFQIKLQKQSEWLLEASVAAGVVTMEFPYRPMPNLQYWAAGVAYIPRADWDAFPPDDYPIYAPPLIVEVLSPSNTPAKLGRQRIIAMSAGTQEFWVLDRQKRTVHVTNLTGARTYRVGEAISLDLFDGGTLLVDDIFAV